MMNSKMFFLLIALTPIALLAREGVQPLREQSQLRELYKQAGKSYSQTEAQIKDKFSEERNQNSSQGIKADFTNATQKVESLEGTIVPEPSAHGESRVWAQRTRVDSYEIRPETKNYYGGPENDVILFNGEFVQNTTDMSLPSRGKIGFSFRRHYDSRTDYQGPMGNGWDFNYNAHLVLDNKLPQDAQKATLYMEGVSYNFFRRSGKWDSAPSVFFRLENVNDQFYIYDNQLSRMEFEKSKENPRGWRLSALASRHSDYTANRIVIQYQDKFDRIDCIQEPYGNKIIFSYDETGRVVQVSSPQNSVKYFYGSSGMLEKVRFANSARNFEEAAPFEIKYAYELVSKRYMMASRVVNNSKCWYSISYDSAGRVAKIGYKSQKQDSTWQFKWNEGHSLSVTPAAPAATMNLKFASQKTLDLPTEISIPTLAFQESYLYDKNGLVIEYINSVGVKQVYGYDAENPLPELRANLLSSVKYPSASLGAAKQKEIIEQLTYVPGRAFPKRRVVCDVGLEGQKRILKTQEYEYSPDFEITSFNDNGIVTRYLSNKYGETAVVLDANNRATINFYSEKWPQKDSIDFTTGQVGQGGVLVAVISDASKEQLDNACGSLGVEPFLFNDILRVKPVALKSYFAYNKQGKVIHSLTGNNESFAIYNKRGNILASFQPHVGITIVNYSSIFMRQSVLHQFDPISTPDFAGVKSAFFNGCFFTETLKYDDHNQISSITKTDELIASRPVTFSYMRYPSGKVKAITEPGGISRVDVYAPNGLISSQYIQGGNEIATLNDNFLYFANGQIRSYTNIYGENVQNGLDAFGRLAESTNAQGIKFIKVFDGVDRVIEEVTSKAGKVLTRKTYQYGNYGLLERQYEYRIAGDKSEKILTKSLLYDAVGNVIASRGIINDSWEYFLYDGLERIVAQKDSVGDFTFSIYDHDLLAMSLRADSQEDKKYRWQGNIKVFDAVGNPVVTIPTDTSNALLWDKIVFTRYDLLGNLVTINNPELNTLEKRYNTIKQIVSEKTFPYSQAFGERPIVTNYSYLPNGKLASKTVENLAMAISGTREHAEAAFLSAPQKTVYSYDALGRESTICQPDGLIVEKRYNANSMPAEMIWKHATDETNILRHLHLKFGKLGRLQSLVDAKTGNVLRSYIYDDYGNRIEEHDGDVTTLRRFDSLGLLLFEQVKVGERAFPGFSKVYGLADGVETLRWIDLPKLSPSNWNSQTTIRDASGRISSIRINDSQSDFATWKYVGSLPMERHIPESQIVQRNTFNGCNELIRTSFFENSQFYGELYYQYDKHGNQIFAATNLAGQTKNPYTYAQYTEYNSLQQVVAQNGEITLPQNDSVLTRREEVLGNHSLQSQKTTRMVFDQVDNIWAQYHGAIVSPLSVKNFNKDNLSTFMSAARILPSFDHISQADLYELSSNRETTQATYSSSKENLSAEENIYDKLGNLIQFKGSFWNGERSMNVIWHLSFDALGRLSYMKGILENGKEESHTGFLQKGDLAAELYFSYDAGNRRIKKVVKDHSRYKGVIEKNEWTVYVGNNQAIVLNNDNMSRISSQYLWRPDSRELLMAALPQNIAENEGVFAICRYYFQQDRGLNTICVTKAENGKATLVSGASYLCFGKNATTAKITNIESSMADSNRSCAMNNNLDDKENTIWENSSSKPQFIEIKLGARSNLSSLKIWTDESFPKEFLAFVLPPQAESPKISDDLDQWANQEATHLVYQYKSETSVSRTEPIFVPLYCCSGDRIVILWDKHEEKEIRVKEFEVGKTPNNPGAIAFAGQWLDRETDMYYQINRYKLAGANRFISPDPIGFFDGNNLYAYAKNNPLNWHDPNGEWVHILLGALAGAGINSGVYAIQCWLTGEDFSWKELAIRAGTGALAGGVAAATFGAVNPLLAGWGLNATANIVVSAGTAGFSGGAASGMSNTLLHGGGIKDAAIDGLKAGGWGAAGGAISGGILSYTGASFGGTLFAGGASGGIVNGTQSALDAYAQTGDWSEAFWGGVDGTWKGAAFGTAVAGAGWGIGKVTGCIQKLEKYPEDLPDPRQGIMIKTKGPERTYDGIQVKPAYARHHTKPLVLGGRDVQSNLEYVPEGIHRQAHPGPIVKAANYGTIFY